MPNPDKPFWRRPMRVMDLALEDSHGSWVTRWTPEQIVAIATEMNANVLNMMVVNEWGQAYWPSPHLPMQPELQGQDRLGPLVERARQAGLHFSAMWGPTSAPCQSERHPDWAARWRDGKRPAWGLRQREKCFMLCMNSPYEDLVNDVLDQLFASYEIDLLALDFYHQEPCWCEYCRQRCLDDTGFDIFADRIPFGQEDVHRNWQDERVRAQILRINETIHRHKAALVTFRIVPGTDVIFSEPHTGDRLDLRDKGYMVARDKAIGRLHDKGNVICTPTSHLYYIGWSKPPAHMRQEFREIGIHGNNPWAVMWDWEILRDPRGLQPLGTVFGEMESITELMGEAEPLRHVALVHTSKPIRSEGPHYVEEHGDALKGFYDALARAHIPFEILCDNLITPEGLQGFSTLILPNVSSLSDDQIETIKTFVSNGGHLISTFETSCHTGEGYSRYEFGLTEVLGARYLDAFETPWCYVTPRQAHPILSHLDKHLGIPHGDVWNCLRNLSGENLSENDRIKAGKPVNTGQHLKVEATQGTEIIASVHDTQKLRGSYFIKDVVPAIPGRDTGYPAIVINRFGQGTSVYFAGQPDRLFHRTGHPDYEQLLVNAVTWRTDEPPVRVEAPNTVETTYWQLGTGQYLVHLLNHTYDAMFPAPATGEKIPASREVFRAIREVVPIHDIKIHLKTKPASVEVLIGDPRLALNDRQAVLETLNEYAVVRIT